MLAGFLAALHRPAPMDAPHNAYRGSVALADRAEAFEQRHAQAEAMHGALDPALRRCWEAGVAAPIDAPRSWFHGDLHGRNVLVKDGRLAGVIDWGDMAAGDPACDLAAVWMLLPDREARRRAMAAYAASDATWARARGWAALMTVMMLSDHRQSAHARDGPAHDGLAGGGAVIALLTGEERKPASTA